MLHVPQSLASPARGHAVARPACPSARTEGSFHCLMPGLLKALLLPWLLLPTLASASWSQWGLVCL